LRGRERALRGDFKVEARRNPKVKPKPKEKDEYEPYVLVLAHHHDRVAKEWKSDMVMKTETPKSLEQYDRLVRLEKRAPELIKDVLTWIYTGSYTASANGFDWRPNLVSGNALRKNWDRLETAYLHAVQGRGKPSTGSGLGQTLENLEDLDP
jgi:hypothetical protein